MENCSKVDLGRIKLHFQTTGTEYLFLKQVCGGEGGATNIRLFKKLIGKVSLWYVWLGKTINYEF